MSHVYSPIGSGAYVGAYTMPDDGDPRNAAAFNVPMEGMAEDIKRVKGSLDGGQINMAVARHYPFLLTSNSGNWSRVYNILTGDVYWSQATHATLQYIEAPLDLPDGFELSELQVWIDPRTGRAGLPAIKPAFFLVQQNNQTGNSANLGASTDPSATLAAYETHHSITISFSPVHVVGRSQWSYSVVFTGESGANAQNGTELYSVKATGTAKKVF